MTGRLPSQRQQRSDMHRAGIPISVLAICLLFFVPSTDAAQSQDREGKNQRPAKASPATPRATPEQLSTAIGRLETKYKNWLQRVAGLITQAELEYFLELREDYRRDVFMEAFWEPRDPKPETGVNELRSRWLEATKNATGLPYTDARFLLYLLNGPPGGSLPDGRGVSRCFSRSKELEIWFYEGSERTRRRFLVIFQRMGSAVGYRAYRRGDSLRPIQRTGGLPSTDIRVLCADELLRYALTEISRTTNYEQLLDLVLTPPRPSPEWLAGLATAGTDLPAGSKEFEIGVEVSFPVRRQNRTGVQVMLGVSRESAPGRRFDGELFHHFLLRGEVIREGRRLEGFRYRFEGLTPEDTEVVPLGFTRYLRPGPAQIRILVEDVFAGRFAQVVREIEVPTSEGLPAVASRPDAPEGQSGPSLRLIVPLGDNHFGPARFRTRAQGEFDKVTFFLDGKPIITKRRPPYSVELNLGKIPEAHRVRVVGFVGDREVATDQIWLNQGAQRFRVRLVEPRPGGIYPGSLTARVEVDTPDGRPADRVELYLNDRQVAVLRESPYTRPLRLSENQTAVVRVVAYLADGSSTEDAVVVNSAGYSEAIEVQLVELHALITDSKGEPIRGLERERFRVLEDGVLQELRRFEADGDRPNNIALLIDRSASMEPYLRRVAEAALTFATAALQSAEDRVALISFADDTSVDAGSTASTGRVERALAGLVAHGQTALYDSIAKTLRSFDGLRGQTALLLFSDGRDETSRLTFEQVLETARRSSVVLYSIALGEAFQGKEERRHLTELAEETGGRAYFLAGLGGLAGVYTSILAELGSRYLLAYNPLGGQPDSGYREVRVEVDLKGAEVRTRRGYYP